VIISFFDKPN